MSCILRNVCRGRVCNYGLICCSNLVLLASQCLYTLHIDPNRVIVTKLSLALV